MGTNWDFYNIFTEELLTCTAGNYPTSDSRCCAEGEFYSSGNAQCEAFANATDCKIAAKGDDKDDIAECLVCTAADTVLYYKEACVDVSGNNMGIKIGGTLTESQEAMVTDNCA